MSLWRHMLPQQAGCLLYTTTYVIDCSYNGAVPDRDFNFALTVTNPCGTLTGTLGYYLEFRSDPGGPWTPIADYGPVAFTWAPGSNTPAVVYFLGRTENIPYTVYRGRIVVTPDSGPVQTFTYIDNLCYAG